MAEPSGIRDTQKGKVQEIIKSGRRLGYHVKGEFLPICKITAILDDIQNNQNKWNDCGEAMMKALKRVRTHHFQHMQVPFPVTNLQHVTGWDSVHGICKQEGFTATQDEIRPELKDLSFWSAVVSSVDTETAHQKAYEAVRKVTPADAELYQGEIKEQFANSPAFKATSRFGNFKFSFPLSDLLSLYQSQHCGDGEPQLRILGTDIYRLEIAHYIVAHGPDTDQFSDLPMVPSVTSSSGPLPFVYMMDGTLFWRPESTSIALKVKISKYGPVIKKCYEPCDYFTTHGYCFHLENGTYSVWNHLVFAFHVPKPRHLNIPQQNLLENLTPCDAGEPFLGRGPALSITEAKQMINNLKDNPNSH